MRNHQIELKIIDSIKYLFNRDSELLDYFFDPKNRGKIRKRPGILRDDSWGLKEPDQLRIRSALDIWSGSGHTYLFELLEHWSRRDWVYFIEAISKLKDIKLS